MYMSKKVLLVTSVPSMIKQFNINNILILKKLGYEVEVASNFYDFSIWTKESTNLLIKELDELSVKHHQIDFSRSPFNIANHHKSFVQMKTLVTRETFAFVHTHAPVSSAITRLICKRSSTKVIYTAHGFHFYKGAPKANWILYYPIEKWLSKYTDVLITINKEDYERATEKFNAKKIEYVPGIGIDVKKFQSNHYDRDSCRKELGLKSTDIMLLSVGELNANKNHNVVIKAMDKLNNEKLHYYIAGIGNQKETLIKLATELGICSKIHFLDFCNNINELLHCTNIYIHPSKREGLPVALMEAMASECICVASNIRGCIDLLDQKRGFLFDLNKGSDALSDILQFIIENKGCLNGKEGKNYTSLFLSDNVISEEMRKIYKNLSEYK